MEAFSTPRTTESYTTLIVDEDELEVIREGLWQIIVTHDMNDRKAGKAATLYNDL